MTAISVEWTTFNRHNPNRNRSGWDFKDDNDTLCRIRIDGDKECINWREYARWYGDNYAYSSRVWINNQLVYNWEDGWLIDLNTYQPV